MSMIVLGMFRGQTSQSANRQSKGSPNSVHRLAATQKDQPHWGWTVKQNASASHASCAFGWHPGSDAQPDEM